ncbi:MAG: cell wall metabolism sensor histidine kinase WalK [Clostridiales Family XIII bacterium]|jgi:two-component system sensor histidine kinase VicK|nr:cell wall metabolism sensor histidine kinase WalK [Clostridiales Family XIII bacterium]
MPKPHGFQNIRPKIVILVASLAALASVIIRILLNLNLSFPLSAMIAVAVVTLSAFFSSAGLSDSIIEDIDVLRRKLDENYSEITTEKDKLETILKQMADGMIAVSGTGRIIHANDAARRMLRISDEDAVHRKYDGIILRFSDSLTLSEILRNLENGVTEGNFSYGGAVYEVRYDKFRDASGGEEGIIIILQDVTERQRIDNMQIDFVANVSHELKTPLTSIKGYTETLLEGGAEDAETAKEFLEIINSETDRMNRLVKDLLQLSRLDTKQQKWYKEESDIVALVRTAVKKIDMFAKSKRQHVNLIFDRDLSIMLNMDRDRIEQVALNILSNSIKYTQEGGRIDVDVFRKGDEVKIVVMDNGIGIPEKELSRVFERFFRVDRSRSSRSMGGTGLGLAISKQIIEEHKGSIDIESILGKGTMVVVALPLPRVRGKRGIL